VWLGGASPVETAGLFRQVAALLVQLLPALRRTDAEGLAERLEGAVT